MSAGSHGVPMIDEEGVPRAVNIRVDCDVKVKGNKNMIGEKAILSLITHQMRQAMVNGKLPISPISPAEEIAFKDILDRKRKEIAREEAKKREREQSRDEDEAEDTEIEAESSSKRARVY